MYALENLLSDETRHRETQGEGGTPVVLIDLEKTYDRLERHVLRHIRENKVPGKNVQLVKEMCRDR